MIGQRLKKGGAAPDNCAQITELEREVASLVEAGVLRSAPAIAQCLQDTESALARLRAQPPSRSVEQLLPQLTERCQSAIDNLERTLATDPRRARMEIAEHAGPIRVRTTPDEIRLESRCGHLEANVLRATGTEGTCQERLVAGACFGLFQYFRSST